MIKKKFQGMSPHRYKDNVLEELYAQEWQVENDKPLSRPTLDYLMDKTNQGNPNPPLTKREQLVANTVIQWLGSPVGQHFVERVMNKLRDVNYLDDLLGL
jgi:hypothetical protein